MALPLPQRTSSNTKAQHLGDHNDIHEFIDEVYLLEPNTQTANYILAEDDIYGQVRMNLAGANTLTFPPDSDEDIPINAFGEGVQFGAGQTTLTPGAGVSLLSPGGRLKTTEQYSAFTWTKVAADTYLISGDLSA